jgi:hypothetical protein
MDCLREEAGMICCPSLRRELARWVVAASLVLVGASGARAEDAYYLLVFGQQQIPNDVNYSHTFATFVRLSWAENAPAGASPFLEVHTISWLPARMRLRGLALCPECGRNADLHTTLRWAQANGMRTSLWGPYAIRPELYEAALRQTKLLESGQVLYKLYDLGYRSNEVSNCIRAVAAVVSGPGRGIMEPGWGESASYRVLCRMEPWILDPGTVHAWVGSALGLDCYPILYRGWSPPHSGALAGPVYRLLAGEKGLQPTYGRPAR